MSFARNSSIDTIIYEDAPGTLYTITTTLTSGMSLYDNTGTEYEDYKVGEILTATSFNLLQTQPFTLDYGLVNAVSTNTRSAGAVIDSNITFSFDAGTIIENNN